MRAKLIQLCFLAGIGAAGYFLLPFTPLPEYVQSVKSRILALSGLGTGVTQHVTPGDLPKELARQHLRLGSPVALQFLTSESEAVIWVRQGQKYYPFKTYKLCPDQKSLVKNKISSGSYKVTRKDLSVDPAGNVSIRLNPDTEDSVHIIPKQETMNVASTSNSNSKDYVMGSCTTDSLIPFHATDIEEIYALIDAALRAGKSEVPVIADQKQHQNFPL